MPTRPDDRPSWGQVTEQVAQAKDNVRAELRAQEQRTHQDISQVRAELIRGFANLEERFNGHEQWHRDELARTVSAAPGNQATKVMAWVSILSLCIAAAALLIPHLH